MFQNISDIISKPNTESMRVLPKSNISNCEASTIIIQFIS